MCFCGIPLETAWEINCKEETAWKQRADMGNDEGLVRSNRDVQEGGRGGRIGRSLGRDEGEGGVEDGAEISTFCCSLRNGSQEKQ